MCIFKSRLTFPQNNYFLYHLEWHGQKHIEGVNILDMRKNKEYEKKNKEINKSSSDNINLTLQGGKVIGKGKEK